MGRSFALLPSRFFLRAAPSRCSCAPSRTEPHRADRLILQIHALQRATALEIDADLLEIVDDNTQHTC